MASYQKKNRDEENKNFAHSLYAKFAFYLRQCGNYISLYIFFRDEKRSRCEHLVSNFQERQVKKCSSTKEENKKCELFVLSSCLLSWSNSKKKTTWKKTKIFSQVQCKIYFSFLTMRKLYYRVHFFFREKTHVLSSCLLSLRGIDQNAVFWWRDPDTLIWSFEFPAKRSEKILISSNGSLSVAIFAW